MGTSHVRICEQHQATVLLWDLPAAHPGMGVTLLSIQPHSPIVPQPGLLSATSAPHAVGWLIIRRFAELYHHGDGD